MKIGTLNINGFVDSSTKRSLILKLIGEVSGYRIIDIANLCSFLKLFPCPNELRSNQKGLKVNSEKKMVFLPKYALFVISVVNCIHWRCPKQSCRFKSIWSQWTVSVVNFWHWTPSLAGAGRSSEVERSLMVRAPVVEHWLEREIAQRVHPMKDRSDDPPHHERTLYLWATSRSLGDLKVMMWKQKESKSKGQIKRMTVMIHTYLVDTKNIFSICHIWLYLCVKNFKCIFRVSIFWHILSCEKHYYLKSITDITYQFYFISIGVLYNFFMVL